MGILAIYDPGKTKKNNMNDISKAIPDFSVQWCDSTLEFESQIFIDAPCQNDHALLQEKLRQPLILLETATTCVAVSEVCWTEPTTVSVVPDRPAFCMGIAVSPLAAAQYGYEGAVNRPAAIGNAVFMAPGKKFTGQGGSGTFRTIVCSFETAYAEAIVGSFDALSPAQLERALDIQNSLMTSLLFRLLKEAMRPGSMSEAVVEACGKALLVEFTHWLNEDQAGSDVRGKLTPRHLAIIEEYLNGVHGKLPSVAELARACGFSERHFLKLFREQKQCSVAQYIKSFQVNRAQTYLLDTDLPLKEIAYRLGFSSPANFTAAFRAATGKTPGQVRKGSQASADPQD